MKTLVLGGTGIIGNHILRELLNRGHEVFALSRGLTPALNLKGLAVKTIKADINDLAALTEAFQGMDWVFHAAAYYPKNAFGIDKHVANALAQTRTVITAARSSGIKRLVYTSSLTTIGHSKTDKIADETCAYDLFECDPHPYFKLKYLIEEEFRAAVAKDGFPVVMVNPTGIFGPYELKPVELCLVPQLARGKIPGYVLRPINVVDAADVAMGHVLAAEKGRIGERYILGGHNIDTKILMSQICEVLGVKAPKLKLPMGVALAVAYANEALSLVLGTAPRVPVLGLKFAEYGQALSSDKAIRELGYAIHPMSPCFERALKWYREIGYC